MADHLSSSTKDEAPLNFLFENSIFLITGAIAALVWANMSPTTHYNFFNFPLERMLYQSPHGDGHGHGDDHGHESHGGETPNADSQPAEPHAANNLRSNAGGTQGAEAGGGPVYTSTESLGVDETTAGTVPNSGEAEGSGAGADGGSHDSHEGHPISLYFIINDIFMAFFFAIATKEVWEAMLPGGSLSNPKKAALPLLATLGGVLGPALVYIGGVYLFSTWERLGNGWAIPCATDIAFSYLVARLIFGNSHPAIAFLLLLAIADDAIGLVIIAVCYPQHPVSPEWLLLAAGAMLLTYTMRRAGIHSFWWYLLIPGAMCWFAFYKTGIHAALGLVPIIPLMPHAQTDLGIFARDELSRNDTLNEFEHWWKRPVEIFLGLFGLCNAGVPLTGATIGTWLVLAGLLIGKPLGITLCTLVGVNVFGLKLPERMNIRDVITVGFVAAIGFTVALFVSQAAFGQSAAPGVLDGVKMGALLSFGAAIAAFVAAKLLGVRRMRDDESAVSSEHA